MDPRPPRDTANAGLLVVGMLFGAFVLVAAACITAVTLSGTSDPAGSPQLDAQRAVDEVDEYLADAGWHQRSARPLPLGAPEDCGPEGWNAGATSRYQSVHDHQTDAEENGEAVIGLTVYRSAGDATADLDRARSAAWVECQRDAMQEESDTGTTATVRVLEDDPRAPGVAYFYSYLEDDELDAGTIQYVVVGRMKAAVTCECPRMGPADRQALARGVAVALAEVQDLPKPGRTMAP